jgi:hypothetical protein
MMTADRIRALLAEIEAKGWPKYSEDPETCMARACEFVGRFRGLLYETP